MIKKLTTEEFGEEIKKPTIVKFYTEGCAPCKMIAQRYIDIAEKNSQYSFCELDANEEYAVTEAYSVLSVPTFILFKGGQEIMRMDHMKLAEAHIKEAFSGVL
jgi:thioredoxin 1